MIKCRKEFYLKFKKTLFCVVATLTVIALPATLFAQDLPCGSDLDPLDTSTCPLDTYVWILVIVAAIFGAIYLHRRQKAEIVKG